MDVIPPTSIHTPVSYTHLDVYKRQFIVNVGISFRFYFIKINITCVKNIFKFVIFKILFITTTLFTRIYFDYFVNYNISIVFSNSTIQFEYY